MNDLMPRLHSDPRSPAMASPLSDMPVVRCVHLAANPRPQRRADKAGTFSPSIFATPGVGGTRAQRIAAAEAMRRWMFDPAPDQLGARAGNAAANEKAQVDKKIMTLDNIKARCFITDEGCWEWRGAMSQGVPRIYAPNHQKPGSPMECQVGRRAVWHVRTGKAIPKGHRVFGTCQNAVCLCPEHARCGTTSDLGALTKKLGRFKNKPARIAASRIGGRKRSHLTAELIAEIQASDETGVAIAGRLKLGREVVSRVRRGKLKSFQSIGNPFAGLLA